MNEMLNEPTQIPETGWIVQPKPLDLRWIRRERVDLSLWGCLGPILILVAGWAISEISEVKSLICLYLPPSLIVLVLIYVSYRSARSRVETRYQDAIQKARGALEVEAREATSSTLSALAEAKRKSQDLQIHLVKAVQELQLARNEFTARAFAPFWDAMERAARALWRYDEGLRRINLDARVYRNNLRDREHTFPTWNNAFPKLLRPDSILVEFEALVRQGQSDFEFASIFEHRRAKPAHFDGIGREVGTALTTIGSSIDNELRCLDR